MRIITSVFSVLIICTVALSQDKGIGVVYSLSSNPILENVTDDTVMIYSDTSLNNVIAQYYFDAADRFNNRVSYDSKMFSIQESMIEYSYEAFGLAIKDTFDTCVKIDLLLSDEISLKGYIKNEDVGIQFWNKFLLDKMLYFENNSRIQFYDKPEGDLIDFNIHESNGRLDYIMKPVKNAGEWLKVLISSPSDNCIPVISRKKEVWVKYIDPKGRPLLWFYPRGC